MPPRTHPDIVTRLKRAEGHLRSMPRCSRTRPAPRRGVRGQRSARCPRRRPGTATTTTPPLRRGARRDAAQAVKPAPGQASTTPLGPRLLRHARPLLQRGDRIMRAGALTLLPLASTPLNPVHSRGPRHETSMDDDAAASSFFYLAPPQQARSSGSGRPREARSPSQDMALAHRSQRPLPRAQGRQPGASPRADHPRVRPRIKKPTSASLRGRPSAASRGVTGPLLRRRGHIFGCKAGLDAPARASYSIAAPKRRPGPRCRDRVPATRSSSQLQRRVRRSRANTNFWRRNLRFGGRQHAASGTGDLARLAGPRSAPLRTPLLARVRPALLVRPSAGLVAQNRGI
jgi:hypothetical protein